MLENTSGLPDTLPLSTEREVDAACLRFEEAWKAGQRPRIEDYLGETSEPTRSALLDELLRLELEYRKRKGEQPTEEEYRSRFPEHGTLVRQVFAGLPRSALPQVPGYNVLEEIGRGGQCVVYKAWQIKAGRFVALKMLLAGEMASPDEIERFQREARAAANLNHPNIVPIYEVGEHAGRRYFTMKLFPDGSLADQVSRSPLPSRRAAEIVAAVARAVHHAHTQKIIHRDLKPGNILLEAGQPHVTDFGLAKLLGDEGARTCTGAVLGTSGYMAPEQVGRATEPTPATDVYGLGAVLYTLLTGRPPFQAASLLDTLAQVTEQLPAPPRLLNPNIDPDLETICLKCLVKKPDERYPDAEEVAEELDRYLRGEPIRARPQSWVQDLWRALGKRRMVLDPLSWSYFGFLVAAVMFGTHTAIWWIIRAGASRTLFAPCMVIHGVLLALIVRVCFVGRRQPFTPDEKHILAFNGYFFSAAVVLVAFAYPWEGESVLALYPVFALLSGIYHLIVARLYWGPMYLIGLAYFLLALVMQLKLEWAPLEFAVLVAAHSIGNGLVLRRYALNASREPDRHP
jgi:serine/threonine-protein kinase